MSVWACESVFGGGGQQGVQQQQTVNVCMLYVLKASSRGQKTQGYSLKVLYVLSLCAVKTHWKSLLLENDVNFILSHTYEIRMHCRVVLECD